MNFDQEFNDFRCIHIKLIGVENLSKEKLDYYSSLLSQNSTISLSNIILPKETLDSLNSKISLTPDDEMVFKFHTDDIGSPNYPLQTHKTFLGLYGIGENVENILLAYKYIEDYSKQYPSLLEWRLFCFEPKLDDNIFESKAEKLILFHPNIIFDKLLMNIGIVLHDLSSMILTGLVGVVSDFGKKECIFLSGETDLTKMRKRKLGRYLKILADLSFLLGNLSDAQKKYEESLEKLKNQGD